MKFQIYLQAEIHDTQGKLIKRIRKKLSHSYVRQFIDMLLTMMQHSGSSGKDTGGVARTISVHANNFRLDGTNGIIPSTDTNPVTISDYALTGQIGNGAGAGQLQYGAMSFVAVSILGSTAQFTMSRTFTNSSGGDITIHKVYLLTTGENYSFLLEATLLEATIANGTSGTLTYTISVTV